MSSSPKSRVLKLQSSDGETFEVEEAVAVQSAMIKGMVEDGCAGDEIPIPNVNSKTLVMVLEWFKNHVDKKEDVKDDALNKYEADFFEIGQGVLFDLLIAADFLNAKGLLDQTCQKIAEMIKGKHPEEICKTLNIKNDFTPEEVEEIKKENSWAFE